MATEKHEVSPKSTRATCLSCYHWTPKPRHDRLRYRRCYLTNQLTAAGMHACQYWETRTPCPTQRA